MQMVGVEEALRKHLRIGMAATVLFVGVVIYWSVFARIDSAVVTHGTVVVESTIKKVQHPTGGVVGAILVREGQRVGEGQLLLRLDETATRAALGIVVNELTATRSRAARLTAERTGAEAIEFPADIVERATRQADVRQMRDGEVRLFASRKALRNGQKAQLLERIGQLEQEGAGIVGQQRALETQVEVARKELAGLRGLESKGLTIKSRLSALEREIARYDGQLSETNARGQAVKGKIAEIRLQVLQLDNDHAAEVSKELGEAESKINELQERRIAAEDQLRRVDVRSPIAGFVHQLAVHTVGGVVQSTDTLMSIVPEADRLIVEVRIQPQDIDQVRVGQAARVRFTAFNLRDTPEVTGELFRVGGDLTKEPQTGVAYFSAGISIAETEMAKLNGLRLMPGMPADAFVRTGARTFASYIVKPLSDQMGRAMRER